MTETSTKKARHQESRRAVKDDMDLLPKYPPELRTEKSRLRRERPLTRTESLTPQG